MAQNFCMTINLMAFIGSKVIEVEDENGVFEEGGTIRFTTLGRGLARNI